MEVFNRDIVWLEPEEAPLQKALEQALENIVARLDRSRGFRPYFRIALDPPARPVHDSWDFCDMSGRYVDAMILIRRHTGLSAPDEEASLRRFLLNQADPGDGLFYNEEEGPAPRAADMFCQSRVLLALDSWVDETGDEAPASALQHLSRGLMGIAVRENGSFRYPRNLYRSGEWLDGGLFYEPKDLYTVKPGYGGTQLEGMMLYSCRAGDETALSFVEGYLRHFLDAARVVDEDGRYAGHLHSQGILPTMVGAAMLAEATGNRDLLRRCERCLRFTLSHCSSFGWVPDGIGVSPDGAGCTATCETCAIADVVHLAMRLSRLGMGDFWREIERFARNQIVENQFLDADRVLVGRRPLPGTAAMVRGSFASWVRPNDLLGGPDLEGCCVGGGVRAIHHVLENVVGREPDGSVVVRMLLPVDAPDARVSSAASGEGAIRVRMKRSARLSLRRPEEAAADMVDMRVNGRKVAPEEEGELLSPGVLAADDELVIRFPVADSVREETVAGTLFRVEWRGGTVTRLSPEGTGYPVYQSGSRASKAGPRS